MVAVAASLRVTQIHKVATAEGRRYQHWAVICGKRISDGIINPLIRNIPATCSLGRRSSKCLPRTQRGTFKYPQRGLSRKNSPGLTRALMFTPGPYKQQLFTARTPNAALLCRKRHGAHPWPHSAECSLSAWVSWIFGLSLAADSSFAELRDRLEIYSV